MVNTEKIVTKEEEKQNTIGLTEPESITDSPVEIRFRSKPTTLSNSDVKTMLQENNFYCQDRSWNKEFCNPDGKGLENEFELQKNDALVNDHASGLMWQQSGSPDVMEYDEAKKWIEKELNQKNYAGFHDWRLPTLDEAMSLMETAEENENLYIDPIFDKTQSWIWTSDLVTGEEESAWVVYFSGGSCSYDSISNDSYVRAVRSGQSSDQ